MPVPRPARRDDQVTRFHRQRFAIDHRLRAVTSKDETDRLIGVAMHRGRLPRTDVLQARARSVGRLEALKPRIDQAHRACRDPTRALLSAWGDQPPGLGEKRLKVRPTPLLRHRPGRWLVRNLLRTDAPQPRQRMSGERLLKVPRVHLISGATGGLNTRGMRAPEAAQADPVAGIFA